MKITHPDDFGASPHIRLNDKRADIPQSPGKILLHENISLLLNGNF